VVAVKEYAKDFYKSDAWKKARVAVIKRANGLCERCRAAGQYKPGVIVHHKKYITPGNIHDARVTLDLNNLEYVCEDCHNKCSLYGLPMFPSCRNTISVLNIHCI